MTDMTVNIPLLRKAVEWAETEAAKPPELCEWEQDSYVLPSPSDRGSFVTSSWYRPGDAPRWAAEEWSIKGKAESCGTCFCIAGYIAHQATGNLDYSAARQIALEALDLENSHLSDSPYDDLFAADNTIEDVRRIAESIAGERL